MIYIIPYPGVHIDNVLFSVNNVISKKQIFLDDKLIGLIFYCTKYIKSNRVN